MRHTQGLNWKTYEKQSRNYRPAPFIFSKCNVKLKNSNSNNELIYFKQNYLVIVLCHQNVKSLFAKRKQHKSQKSGVSDHQMSSDISPKASSPKTVYRLHAVVYSTL